MAKKKKKESSVGTIFLVFVLIGVIVAGTYYNREQPVVQNVLRSFSGSEIIPVEQFLASKQEITDAFGGVPDIIYNPDLSWNSTDQKKRIHLSLQGPKTGGELSLTVTRPEGQWRYDGLELTIDQHKQSISPIYVSSAVFRAASLSSAPLKQPVFAENEDIYLSVTLSGITPGQPQYRITQALKIYDQDNQLIAAQNDIAHYDSPTYQEKIPFIDKIGHLLPGTYYLELIFNDHNTKQTETYWQEIQVKKIPVAIPVVRRVIYATDAGFGKTRREPLFTAGEAIHVRLELGGFKVSDKKISGTVSLSVTNSVGKVVAKNPKFAAFTKPYEAQSTLVVSGTIKLTDPDVYLLTFTIEDFFNKMVTTHEEKLVIKLLKK